MEAFRLAKEATVRALDSPMIGLGRLGGLATPPAPVDDEDADRGSSSLLSEARNKGVRVVKVRANARTGEGLRSRL